MLYCTHYFITMTHESINGFSAMVMPPSQSIAHCLFSLGVTPSKYACNYTWLLLPSASLSLHYLGLLLYLCTYLFTAFKSTQLWPTSMSPHVQVHLITVSNFAWLLLPNASPKMLYLNLQVHLCIPMISAPRWITMLTQSWPPSVSLISVKCILVPRSLQGFVRRGRV